MVMFLAVLRPDRDLLEFWVAKLLCWLHFWVPSGLYAVRDGEDSCL
ncbi:hypothetical protein FHX09_004937 [Rhizobium sp. BK538]|nr:hypothetical protein [Rhizobium sp. BK060]MBB4171051.1 hypothetical protein [Rhizobium sp. BK538]